MVLIAKLDRLERNVNFVSGLIESGVKLTAEAEQEAKSNEIRSQPRTTRTTGKLSYSAVVR